MGFKKFVYETFVRPFVSSEGHTMPSPASLLPEPLSVGPGADLREGEGFTGAVVAVSDRVGSVLISFERKTRIPQLRLDFELEGSLDGQTWGHFLTIPVPFEKSRIVQQVDLRGLTHIKLGAIRNHGDALENVQALILF